MVDSHLFNLLIENSSPADRGGPLSASPQHAPPWPLGTFRIPGGHHGSLCEEVLTSSILQWTNTSSICSLRNLPLQTELVHSLSPPHALCHGCWLSPLKGVGLHFQLQKVVFQVLTLLVAQCVESVLDPLAHHVPTLVLRMRQKATSPTSTATHV